MATPVDSTSISNYGYNSLYSDPAWQKYWMMSSQMDSLAAAQNANALGALTQSAKTDSITATSPSFGAIPRAAESSGSGSATAAVLAIGATAVGTAWWIASRGKAAGAKGLMNQLKAGFKSFGKSANTNALQFTTINGKKVCMLPNQTNKIYVDPKKHSNYLDMMKQELEKIGLDNGHILKVADLTTTKAGKTVLADGVAIRSGSFNIGGNIIKFKNGKVVSYTDSAGKDILARYTDPGKIAKYKATNEAAKKQIDDFLAGLKEGTNLNQVSNLEAVINQNGILRKMTNKGLGSDLKLNYALSKRFSIKDKVVDAYRLHNESANKLLTKFEKGETGLGKIVGAEWTAKMHDGKKYTFIIENNQIKGIRNHKGKVLTQTEMDSLQYNNSKIFDNVFKKEKEFQNIIYQAA